MVEQHPFTDRAAWLLLRQKDITASVAGALLGVHEYQTPYGLWALKTGQIQEDAEETPAMRRGRLLEPVALALLGEERPEWKVIPNKTYFRDPVHHLGATPDAFATCPERGMGIVQVKTVEAGIFRRKWVDSETGEVELPLWIAVQAIIEAHLTGAKWACVAAMVVSHGLDLQVVDVPIHPGIVERIRTAIHEFWNLVESGQAPDPDYSRDGALLARLMVQDNGGEIDLSADNMLPIILEERERLKAEIKANGERCDEIDAEVRAKVGEAQVGRMPGWKITLKTQHTKAYTVKERTTRPIRITRTKGEAA